MPFDLSDKLVIGLSSRALFDLESENALYEKQGVTAYSDYQRAHEDQVLSPGTAFPLVKALLGLNELVSGKQFVEVVLMSRNTADTGMRVFNSIEHYQLPITRAAFSGGEPIVSYLQPFKVDLFLSKSQDDVQSAVNAGLAAATLYAPPTANAARQEQIRIAFDGDAVLFSPESEFIYKEKGLDAFYAHEQAHRFDSMREGPFAKLLILLAKLQKQFPAERCPVRIAIVTARASPAHARVVHTLRAWGVTVDEAFFLGGVTKHEVLAAFGAHIFFDDQDVHLASAAPLVPSAKVPYRQA
ncbi:5'-nucleotidase [Uliginosibacterium aquaticum]|uniref:5'-nucleotidase n=1 Tax=Uliginosibacterium aquaticum TaxID=2731212 RepID=A0ABX2IL29_9RHOO|nr:5'-nucleotidase [Uliginosibacterium aquaticum]NSL57022.1 5'-nucleotidase [Uliginosibacterium aquaticum]